MIQTCTLPTIPLLRHFLQLTLSLPPIQLAIAGLLIAGTLGCANVEGPKAATGPKFASARLPHDAVALEIGVVQLDDSQGETFEQFWNTLDHQKLDLPSRQTLDQNGLRTGIMASQPPAIFFELTEPRPVELESLDMGMQEAARKGLLEPASRLLVHKRIINRKGESYRVETSDLFPDADWTVRRGDRSTSGSGKDVQGLFEITTHPQGDNTVRLRFTPKIEYGPVLSKIGVADSDFTYNTGRAGQRVTELDFELILRAGETVVIAPTPDRTDLGYLLFESPEGKEDIFSTSYHLTHRALLVRLVQTRRDDLFGDTVSGEPLSTHSTR